MMEVGIGDATYFEVKSSATHNQGNNVSLAISNVTHNQGNNVSLAISYVTHNQDNRVAFLYLM